MVKRSVLMAAVVMVTLAVAANAAGRQETPQADRYSIGVFVPGIVEGSPTYELLVDGVRRAVGDEPGASYKVVEGGFNQALWKQGLTSMAASGEYDLIVSSNPAIPDLVLEIAPDFPSARFLIMDAYLSDHGQVHTVMFNQREQAFLAGHFAGLVGREMLGSTSPLRAGLLAGQEYPIMNNVIVPAYELGLRSVDPAGTVDLRVLGNWYDAGRAAELANSMYATGSHIILPIAGGGNQGVIASARERKTFVVWYDTSGYHEAPGIVIGSTYVALDAATRERTRAAIRGELVFGEAEVLGVADGYVGFVEDDPLYRRHVSEPVRAAMRQILSRMESGELYLDMPLR